MTQIEAVVIANIELTKGVYLLQLKAPEIAFIAKPGQFIMIRCDPHSTLRRPFSIHYTKNAEDIFVLFAAISIFRSSAARSIHPEKDTMNNRGIGTSWLSRRIPGEIIDVLGPLGNGYHLKSYSQKIVLVAGGIGIAPLLFMANEAIKCKKDVTLLMGARSDRELYPQQLLPQESRNILVTEDGSIGSKGLVSDKFPDYIADCDQIFTCGPLPMYQSIHKIVNEKSIKIPIQVSMETRMACGVGACYSCSVNTSNGMKTVCKDGPIFDISEVIWDELSI